MAKARIKKGDMVLVISGKNRDLALPRRVLLVSGDRVMVEGANMIKRHTRPNAQGNIKGGILEKEAPMHMSNLMPVDPETKRPTRVGTKFLEDGRRVRMAIRSGALLDS